MNKYNLRKSNEIKPPVYLSDYDTSYSNIEDDMFKLKESIPKYNFNENTIKKLKDYKLPPLHKKYFRPYFSPKFNSWEMDFMIVPFKDGISPFETKESHTNLYYLFIININTKYLCVSHTHNKDTHSVIWLLNDMMDKGLEIDNIRGDADVAFRDQLLDVLRKSDIKYYFTANNYINRNRVVDRVMRTIRDKFDELGHKASLYDVELMQKVVDKYNHTTHAAFDYRFTPAQVQNNKQLERIFIMDKKSKLENIPKNDFIFQYKPKDIILVHVPFKEINYKRRRNFSHLAAFVQYLNGNVQCVLIYPDDEYSGKTIVIPVYYTKPYNALNENDKNYFNI
jgi:hypothetical protein